jgi:sodium-dependent dicarboxylate transporter 2/3/5
MANSAKNPSSLYSIRQKALLIAAPLLWVLMVNVEPPQGMSSAGWKVALTALLMAVLWVGEVIPVSATALLPLICFPLLGISNIRDTAAPYASPIIFLFLGGFLIAIAIQKWQLHTRIALSIVRLIGTNPVRMVGGFMLAAALLSMWISNTATILMMLPLSLAIVELLIKPEKKGGKADPAKARFATAMMLGMCYAVSIGGIGTIVGTPPNAFLKGFLENQFGYYLDFFTWMQLGVPVSLLLLFSAWWVLTRWLFPCGDLHVADAKVLVEKEWKRLGTMQQAERRIALVAGATALCWVFGSTIREIFPLVNDTVIAMIAAVSLFLIPADFKRGVFLLNWEDTVKLPWGVLILFGGGLALASGVRVSGLDMWLAGQVDAWQGVSIWVFVVLLMVLTLLMTEMISNIATTTIMLPVLSAVAIGLNQNPLLFVVPATMAASCGFMMPVATAANAIVFGTGYVNLRQMIKAGFVLNLLGLAIILVVFYTLGLDVLDISLGTIPAWVK